MSLQEGRSLFSCKFLGDHLLPAPSEDPPTDSCEGFLCNVVCNNVLLTIASAFQCIVTNSALRTIRNL